MVRIPTLIGAVTLALSKMAAAKYTLSNSYDATNFFDGFEFRNGTGSSGFAQYVDAATAEAKSLAGIRDGKVYLGVDNTTENTTGGRQSVRVITKNVWTNGVYIADIAHMPGNACGVWPAYWTSDPDWPNSGEIDIIESVNMQKTPIITLHSGKNCVVTNTGSAAGSVLVDPDWDSSTSSGGCSQTSTNTHAYGVRLQRDRWGCVRNAMDNERNFGLAIPPWQYPGGHHIWGSRTNHLGHAVDPCKRVGINSRVQCEGCYL
ncbi:hypothetical protein N7530_000441 [Penicillium desertorum]|uniref:GH16 domain-containing protein n=1 Tax=Penicillium desertorum TaxID=1303715 RepID=A0A9W9X8R1_9EURO|nr:hypothetical protein N7530_000441 [Penicillium desertorum]